MSNKLGRKLLTSVLVVMLLVFVGCSATTMPGLGGVTPGLLINSTTVPGDLTADVLYAAYPDSFVVLGMVEGTSSSTNILGLFSFGDGGYLSAIEDAMYKAEADGLINCTADVRASSFFMLFAESKTVVRGLAIKHKK